MKKEIGFLNDQRRMNVGLTRAKYCLIVVGNAETLVSNIAWKQLIQSAQERNCFIKVRNDSFSSVLYRYKEQLQEFREPIESQVLIPQVPTHLDDQQQSVQEEKLSNNILNGKRLSDKIIDKSKQKDSSARRLIETKDKSLLGKQNICETTKIIVKQDSVDFMNRLNNIARQREISNNQKPPKSTMKALVSQSKRQTAHTLVTDSTKLSNRMSTAIASRNPSISSSLLLVFHLIIF